MSDPFDFSDVLAEFSPEVLFLERRGPSTYVDGYATKPEPTQVLLSAVLWPATPSELRVLPEGYRTSEAVTLATTEPLLAKFAGNVNNPDRFSYQGSLWEVASVLNWSQKAGYYLSIATRLAEV